MNRKEIINSLLIYMNVGNDIGDPPAHMRYCLTEDTLVNTNYGLIQIKDLNDYIKKGLLIESIDKQNYATDWFDSDYHPVINIQTEYGYEITGTYNHPLLVLNNDKYKWKLLNDINENDYLVINCKQNQISANWDLITQDDTIFLGLLFADSSIRKLAGDYYHITIKNYNPNFYNYILKYLQQLADNLNIKSKIKTKTKNFKKHLLYEITINSKILYLFFRDNFNYHKDQRLFSLPNIVLKSSINIQKLFLSYLFETHAEINLFNDKQAKKGRILYASQSKIFIQQLQTLLLQFGIISKTYKVEKKKPLYKLLINKYEDLYLFQQHINFVTNNKKRILQDILDNIPRKMINRKFIITKVVNKQYLQKEKRVYSIKVNSNCHSFTANGFINHNTEAKLNKLAEFNLEGINNNAVDTKLNYSDILTEPITLPGLFPNLLANGTSGIAVGYATNIPSHNLNELCNAIIAYIKDNDISLDSLLQLLPGPDFPNGSLLINNEEIKQLYKTGKGKLTFKANYKIKDNTIIINELPPDVNRERLVEKLQQLCLIDKKIPRVESIKDLSTTSTNILIELQKTAVMDIVLKSLFEQTELIKNCSFVIRAIINNTPKVFSLKECFYYYVQHRRLCINNESNTILNKLNKKLHIQNGINKVINSLTLAIKLIEQAETDKDAKEQLQRQFNIDEEQAEAILEFKLRRLTKLNKNDILDNIKKLTNDINDINQLLNDPSLIDQKIINQLEELKNKFGDSRRTKIINNTVIKNNTVQEALLILTHKNNIQLISLEALNNTLRSGILKEKSEIYKKIIKCKTDDIFLLILEDNNYVKLNFTDLLAWNSKVNIINIFIMNNENKYIVCITQKGLILKINSNGFKARNKKLTPIFNNCENTDKIIYSQIIDSDKNNIITLISQKGIINRFYEQSFKDTLTANKKGISAITLKKDDLVSDAYICLYNVNDRIIIYTKHETHFGYKMLNNDLVGIKSRINKGTSFIQFMSKDPGLVHKILIVSEKYINIDNRGRIHNINIDQLELGTKISRPIKINYDPIVIDF